jgi:hypothetical protein
VEGTLPDGTYLNATSEAYELLTEKSGPLEVTLASPWRWARRPASTASASRACRPARPCWTWR